MSCKQRNSRLNLFHQRRRLDSELYYQICDTKGDCWAVGYMATGRKSQKCE